MASIGVLGAGSWGTALAILLNSNGNQVSLWARDPDLVANVLDQHENRKYLPGISLESTIHLTSDLEECIESRDSLVIAVPSHAVRSVISRIEKGNEYTAIISTAKGIENETLLRVSQILCERFDEDLVAVLSGPSHAEEVSRGIPTAVVSASSSSETAEWVQSVFMSSVFRVYTSSDVVGVEIGAAIKNIIAVAAGIIDGVGAGDNTKAALLTRALAETTRLGLRLGADSLTFAGLSGMGDLIVSCMSKYSRNRHLGEQIGRGKSLGEALSGMVMVAEGVRTTKSAYELAAKYGVEVPIISEAHKVLFENKDPKQGVFDLMTRAAKIEDWG
ncbi:NAD(P)H-dependent glycerol-3-phosphate dehydrogenase [bacterium]|nr:NAD(P)H-dependent glycerol-3-phosphate dehydrogenase [bacterium]